MNTEALSIQAAYVVREMVADGTATLAEMADDARPMVVAMGLDEEDGYLVRAVEQIAEGVLAIQVTDRSDRETCEHGTYVGGPLGPDYLCGWCEDGAPWPDYVACVREILVKDVFSAIAVRRLSVADAIAEVGGAR